MSDQPNPPKPEREAAEWAAKLSRPSVTEDDIRGFFRWRRADVDNDRAWREIMAARRTHERYAVRPDGEGYSVVDIWTAQPTVLAMVPQTGMSAFDAEELAALLNRRAAEGDRSIRQ